MRRLPLLAAMLLSGLLAVQAQTEPEYRLELGAGAGLVAYEGDYNASPLSNQQPMGMLVAKYKLNPRMAWAMTVGFGSLKGNLSGARTAYPEGDVPQRFSSSLTDVSLRYEYNFWAFGTGQEYRGAKKLAPFITLGTGLSFASPDGADSASGLQLQLGAGVKYKLAPRLNLSAEWVIHFTGTDGLDGVTDPYGIDSSGPFKNTDSYSHLALSLTYDLWARCKTCHRE